MTLILIALGTVALCGALYFQWRRASEIKKGGEATKKFFEMANDAIYVVDILQGKILAANSRACNLTGIARDELLKKTLQDLHPPEDVSKSAEFIAEVWEKKGLVYQDISLINKQGERIPVEISANMLDYEGKQAVLLYARDIRVRLSNEKKIRDYTKSLEDTNRELRDTQSRLLQSEKLASIGNLAAGVAHEMNSPLGVISSNANSSKRAGEIIGEVLGQTVETIPGRISKAMNSLLNINESTVTAVTRISQIVNSLKGFTKLDQSEVQDFNIHEGIEQTLILLEHQYKDKVQIQKVFDDIPKIRCHGGQINQVIMSIIQNAIAAMESGGTLKIETRIEKDFAIVEYKDNGTGISKHNLKSVFEPGFSTKGDRIGAGFGLSITYRILEDHGGWIKIESEESVGTLVSMALPLALSPEAAS